MNVVQKSYDEIIDLLARSTGPADLLAFRPSVESQERLRYLLSQNAADELTPMEEDELDRLSEIEHLMQLVKARAKLYVDDPS